MDLRVSVALLFIFLTGGYSLKCYYCIPDGTGFCAEKVVTCSAGHNIGVTNTVERPIVTVTTKACIEECVPGIVQDPEGGTETLYNAADGVYKGSFLLLLSPLLFYFRFYRP